MNNPGFSDNTLLTFHDSIKRCLDHDDKTVGKDKLYEVRSFPDWKKALEEIEAVLTERGLPFDPIDLS